MKKAFRLQGLDCANCASKIERALQKLDGVTAASVNFVTTKLLLEVDDARTDAILLSARAAIRRVDPNIAIRKA